MKLMFLKIPSLYVREYLPENPLSWVDKDMDGEFDERIIFDHLQNPIRTLPFP